MAPLAPSAHGAAPAATALIAGQVGVVFLNAGPAEASARDGRARFLGVGAVTRIPLLPKVLAKAELGMSVKAATWFGLLGPAGLPPSIATRMVEVSAEAVSSPQVEVFRVQAALPVKATPEQMRRFIAADRERRASVVKELNVRSE
ncbi:hypothetical protein GCM10011504_38320 [Siccirubricoccus deserti]|uniref:Tripartite tricarboxylate transporter substrate binding protein n=1 Tax=Siccirubricoccus deserti TaxID=2013562 RepID=A0A9X0UIG3_9PROT|nr:tripartite tricarboxylate transporter substrate-binding protein [Siccirubricoccus deserti]MBC4017080.1 hypothetical protein [Siccirubricoccus deserti]GGC56310.1 hypothetical protein GCM10011504_38320 [Siccirubricoccus deserti]